MTPQPLQVLAHLRTNLGDKAVQMRRVVAASKTDVLPHKDAELVAERVELIALIDAAAPNAKHVLVSAVTEQV